MGCYVVSRRAVLPGFTCSKGLISSCLLVFRIEA